MEKQTKHDTEHRDYVTPFCRPFQKSGLENADENMFTFSFEMTFDNAGNISNSCKNILAGHDIFFPLLGQAQVTSAESFPWTRGYELKTRRRRKRGLTFWAIVFGFTQAAKAKCFAIIIQGGLSLFWFKPQRVLKTEAVIFSDHSWAFRRDSRETADCQQVRGLSSTAC